MSEIYEVEGGRIVDFDDREEMKEHLDALDVELAGAPSAIARENILEQKKATRELENIRFKITKETNPEKIQALEMEENAIETHLKKLREQNKENVNKMAA